MVNVTAFARNGPISIRCRTYSPGVSEPDRRGTLAIMCGGGEFVMYDVTPELLQKLSLQLHDAAQAMSDACARATQGEEVYNGEG